MIDEQRLKSCEILMTKFFNRRWNKRSTIKSPLRFFMYSIFISFWSKRIISFKRSRSLYRIFFENKQKCAWFNMNSIVSNQTIDGTYLECENYRINLCRHKNRFSLLCKKNIENERNKRLPTNRNAWLENDFSNFSFPLSEQIFAERIFQRIIKLNRLRSS